jgi:hypothetical protein
VGASWQASGATTITGGRQLHDDINIEFESNFQYLVRRLDKAMD